MNSDGDYAGQAQAAHVFARSWNRLDPGEFLALLGPDARYASQWVFEELEGEEAIGSYLRGKMATIEANSAQSENARVRVEIGSIETSNGDRPCALMYQGQSQAVAATVVFEVKGGRIVRYDLCIPEIMGAKATGVFPI